MDIQSKEFRYFLDNHDELYSKYPNKYIVIKDQDVLYSENSFAAALEKAINSGLEVGTFIIQLCSLGEDGYTQKFGSRVIFA